MSMKSMGQYYTARNVLVGTDLTATTATAGAEIDRQGYNALAFIVTTDFTGATAQDAEVVVTFKDGMETGVLEDCTTKAYHFANNDAIPVSKANPTKVFTYIGANRYVKPSFALTKASATGVKFACVAVLDKADLFK